MAIRKNTRTKRARHEDSERTAQVIVRLLKARAAAVVLARGESAEGNILMQVGVLDQLAEAIELLGSKEALGLESAFVHTYRTLKDDLQRSEEWS